MPQLTGGTSTILLATGVSYLSAFLVSKVVAVELGTSGIAVAGAVASTAAIAASIALLGQLNSIPVWVASHPSLTRRRTVDLAIKATVWMLPLALVPTLVISVPLLADYGTPALLAVGISLAALGQAWGLLLSSLLSTFGGPKDLLRQATVSGAFTALLTSATVVALGPEWLAVAIGLGSFAGQGLATLPFVKSRGGREGPTPPAQLREYAGSGMGSYPGVVMNAVIIGGLPLLVLTLTSDTTAGLFRAAWSLSMVILAVAFALLKSIYFPEVARILSLSRDSAQLHSSTGGRLALIVGSGSIVVCILAPLLLRLLYSAEFVAAASSLAALTLLGTARAGLYLNQFWLNANGRGRDFSLVEGAFLFLLLLGVVGGSRVGTSLAIAVACAAAGIASLAFSELLLARRSLLHPLAHIPAWGMVILVAQVAVALATCVADALGNVAPWG